MGDFVRDKDAVATCAIIAEIAAWSRNQGKSLIDILNDIYGNFGLYKEKLISITRKGQKGNEEIQTIMRKLRTNPPRKLYNSDVRFMFDYQSQQKIDFTDGLRTEIKWAGFIVAAAGGCALIVGGQVLTSLTFQGLSHP